MFLGESGWYEMSTQWWSETTSSSYAGVATTLTVSGNVNTYPGAGSGVTNTPTRETRVLALPGVSAATIQYAVPSGGYLKIEW